MKFIKGAVIGSIQMADNEKIVIPNEETEKFHCNIKISKELSEAIKGHRVKTYNPNRPWPTTTIDHLLKPKKENPMKEVVNLLIDKLERKTKSDDLNIEMLQDYENKINDLSIEKLEQSDIIENLRDEVQQYETVLKAVQDENNNKQDLEEKDARIKKLEKINNNLYLENQDLNDIRKQLYVENSNMGISLRNIQYILKGLEKPYDKLESIANCWFPDQEKTKDEKELEAFKKQYRN